MSYFISITTPVHKYKTLETRGGELIYINTSKIRRFYEEYHVLDHTSPDPVKHPVTVIEFTEDQAVVSDLPLHLFVGLLS